MPKKDKPKENSSAKNPTRKSTRRSAQTIANKERKLATRAHKLGRAQQRREFAALFPSLNEDYVKRELRSRKKREAAIARSERAVIQIERVAKKRDTRRRLSAMKPAERRQARENGRRQFSQG